MKLLPSLLGKWSFEIIEAEDANRSQRLECADSTDAMVTAIQKALSDTLKETAVRFGWEQASGNPENHRAVIQFPVSEDLFDWFFNARTGYRAHYYVAPKSGLDLNAELIDRIHHELNMRLNDIVEARLLNGKFEDRGSAEIPKYSFLDSLDVNLSKIWFCTKLVEGDGRISVLPLGVTGPRLLLDNNKSWAAPYRDSKDSWLDVKGAFLGESGLYQPKDSLRRAETLHSNGEA